MEEKKSDKNTLIGFLLIGAIILYMMYMNQKDTKNQETEDEDYTEEVSDKDTVSDNLTATNTTQEKSAATDSTEVDSTALALEKEKYGAFGYSAGLSSAKDETTVLENEILKLEVSNKGGQIIDARLKEMYTLDSVPIKLVKDDNASFGLNLLTADNKKINTEELYFEPELTESGDHQILSMKLKVSDNQYLEYVYTLKPDDYMMDFAVKSHGLKNVIHPSEPIELNWKLKAYRYDQSTTFENRYVESIWHYKENKHSSQQARKSKESEDEDISWIAYRQHFFSSILLTDKPFKKGKIYSENLVDDEEKDTLFTKGFASTIPLELKGGEIDENMNLFYGPSDYELLKKYDRNLDEVVPMGWGIFGWINKYIFIPLLAFFMKYWSAGIAIIIMTIIVKIILSPVQYKQFLSQAKQKVLRPEIQEINEKYEDNQMKRQQETMALNRKAGINPASGCLVGLIQLPIFYALFRLFPGAFSLRHKSFLWAEDLASYDVIAELPFNIPFYGSHISLFPILASLAIFFYMTINMSGQNMPKQPGMPNMKFIMYLSPLFMLVFFNSYPSGLSLYYFTSNLISVGIVLVIKNFIIDEDKIHAQIQENKKKPKKQSRFQRKMKEMMEEAERQKKLKNK